ncbi:Ditrans,polycis-undecaprenyl-diphosphate synthase ((2E,6E)-farnesyl-diphosphate specific) [Candidatus Erwinia haradaeae]|uniref:Ditrans,polycis-undecaprenyl-diphosphate synthase ((2E,6E)-farnesyl-diphosphate specific) n=1 Tax=Candidatus Erwinia haradaeae TaxID=1922217 RepID=A0A451CYX1_9GAMM|nr:(2E,6E)-farnesyl-diphosphate-specific ditrans,polycis-undecaprenyl-diphosphate synthase [Candidatus Erwinia haradaeae]VFP78570.1 Ditrans,polycis-undecaprenyl-diphosphate synthase ((2E,6E)-farnesyl-diphosphate specific) [Candidatus Erwinia haradaeae]
MSFEKQVQSRDNQESQPRHVAIIMDGNGRWARNQGKRRISGHQAGIESVRRAVSFSVNHHLDALTLYAFSRENWNRPAQEVMALLELFILVIDSEINSLHKNNVRLKIIGDISRFSRRLQDSICRAEDKTKKNKGLRLNIAANYGGRWDIIHGVRKIAWQVKDGLLQPEQIEEETLGAHLCLHKIAPVDLVIRTGGEYRISNFLLWQIAYAEFWFTDTLWPDFDEYVFEGALNAFAQRERRFGGTSL